MRKHDATTGPDGHAIRSQRTRTRILAESLRLFNAHGESRVTTGMIADAAGISPGNLHYHFRTREAILAAHFDALEAAGFEPGAVAGGPEALEDLWLYLHLMLEALHRYRFLHRDEALPRRDRALGLRFRRLLQGRHRALVQFCTRLAEAGLLRASREEIATLADNVLVVATFWPSYRATLASGGAEDDDAGQGAWHVISLVAPFLETRARAHLERLGRRYLD